MNPIQALASALTSKEVSFLQTMERECARRERISRNAGFTNFWREKASGFRARIEQVQREASNAPV